MACFYLPRLSLSSRSRWLKKRTFLARFYNELTFIILCLVRCQALESEKALLVEENHRDRELHSILRNKFDEMTKKFDT